MSQGSTVSYTYAELTKGGNTSIIDAYARLGVDENDILLDVGSGFGTFIAHAARRLGCKAWGIEIVPERISNAARYFQHFVDKGMDLRLAMYFGDIFDFDGLGPTTVVHLYDQAFEPWQVIHCIHCALRTASVRYISSAKAGGTEHHCYKQLFAKYGFVVKEVVCGVSKERTNSSNTFVIFENTKYHKTYTGPRAMFPIKMGNGKMSENEFVTNHLQCGWDTDVVGRLKYLKEIEQGPFTLESSGASRRTSLPDNMIDSRLYGDRLNYKLFDTFVKYYKPAEVLFDRIIYPLHLGEFGEALYRENLNCRLADQTRINLYEAAESGQLGNGEKLSSAERDILWGFVDLVTYASYSEDCDGKKVWRDPFYREPTSKDRAFDRFSCLNMAKLIHYAPTFNPIREANKAAFTVNPIQAARKAVKKRSNIKKKR